MSSSGRTGVGADGSSGGAPTGPSRRCVGWLVAAVAVALLATATWYWGAGKVELPAERFTLREGVVHVLTLHGSVHFSQVYVDGTPLGPELETWVAMISRGSGSWWQRTLAIEEAGDAVTVVALVTGDDRPLGDRTYQASYEFRSHTPAFITMWLSWLLVPGAALGLCRSSTRERGTGVRSLQRSQWAVLWAFVLFTAFVLQAELSLRPALPWFVAVAGLAALAAGGPGGGIQRPPWAFGLWTGALFLWAGCSVLLAPSPYASVGTFLGAAAGCLFGALLVVVFRGKLSTSVDAAGRVLLGLWACTLAIMAVRAAGVDILGGLALLDLDPLYLENPWTQKVSLHWLVLLAWTVVVADTRSTRGVHPGTAMVLLATGAAVWVGGSKSTLIAWAVGVVVAGSALVRPRWTRRLLIGGALAVLLSAPFVYRWPWKVLQASPEGPPVAAGRLLEVTTRGGIWEYAGKQVWRHPWTGWGIGASGRMPGTWVPLGDALGLPREQQTPGQRMNAALPGGHPHSLPLLIWLDLGLVGAILVGGLLVELGRALSRFEGSRSEESRALHAALLGSVAVTLTILSVNYPAWHPTVLAVLWMSAALVTAILPTEGVRSGGEGPGARGS